MLISMARKASFAKTLIMPNSRVMTVILTMINSMVTMVSMEKAISMAMIMIA